MIKKIDKKVQEIGVELQRKNEKMAIIFYVQGENVKFNNFLLRKHKKMNTYLFIVLNKT